MKIENVVMFIISRLSLWPASLLALYVGRRRPLSYALGITFLRLVAEARPAAHGPFPRQDGARFDAHHHQKRSRQPTQKRLMPNSKTRIPIQSFSLVTW